MSKIALILAAMIILAVAITGCAQRVLVRDCQQLEGSPFQNCEVVEKL